MSINVQQPRYKIEHLSTTGWELVNEHYRHMPKGECAETIQYLIDKQEFNPNKIRAVRDDV
tara:strand:+ start:537 stop:719 length:183 start_codon:yes stop_codon:yes gene_type:complete